MYTYNVYEGFHYIMKGFIIFNSVLKYIRENNCKYRFKYCTGFFTGTESDIYKRECIA